MELETAKVSSHKTYENVCQIFGQCIFIKNIFTQASMPNE